MAKEAYVLKLSFTMLLLAMVGMAQIVTWYTIERFKEFADSSGMEVLNDVTFPQCYMQCAKVMSTSIR